MEMPSLLPDNFDFLRLARSVEGASGNGQVTVMSFAIPQGSLVFWRERLAAKDVSVDDSQERFGQKFLSLTDGDGLWLELIETAAADPSRAYPKSGVPRDFAICGFHSVTLSETGYQRTKNPPTTDGVPPKADRSKIAFAMRPIQAALAKRVHRELRAGTTVRDW